MINFINMTPQVYSEESRDFQLLCKIGDFAFNEVKYEADTIPNILNTEKIKDNILPLLQTKLGFFSSATNLTNDELRMILRIFPDLIKLKGSELALKYLLNACLKLYNISAQFQIEKVNTATRIGQINFDKYSILVGINKVIDVTNIVQELIKYIMPPGYKVYIYYYSDIPVSSNYLYRDYIDLLVTSDNINSQVRHFTTYNTYYAESSGDKEATRINYYGPKYIYNTVGLIDAIRVVSGYENIEGWVSKSRTFRGVFKNANEYPTIMNDGDIIINSILNKIYYYENNTWNEMHFYGLRKSLSSSFDPVDYGVFGIKNSGNKLYYRYDSTTNDWIKLNYRGESSSKFITNPVNNDFIRSGEGNKYYLNGSWMNLGTDLGIASKKPDSANDNDFLFLNEVRYYIRKDGKDYDFTDSFFELVYETTNKGSSSSGILGVGVLGEFILGGTI